MCERTCRADAHTHAHMQARWTPTTLCLPISPRCHRARSRVSCATALSPRLGGVISKSCTCPCHHHSSPAAPAPSPSKNMPAVCKPYLNSIKAKKELVFLLVCKHINFKGKEDRVRGYVVLCSNATAVLPFLHGVPRIRGNVAKRCFMLCVYIWSFNRVIRVS